MAGWFQIQREGGETTIKINRTEIRNDARNAIDRGREFLDKREQQFAEQEQNQQQQFWPQEQVAVQPQPGFQNQAYPNQPYQNQNQQFQQQPQVYQGQQQGGNYYPPQQYPPQSQAYPR